ncbi:hypothetical protein Tco_0133751 [Tanacetum coccineum]
MAKPSCRSNSQSVQYHENVFQSFNSYAKAVWGNKFSWTCRANRYMYAGAVLNDCIDLDVMERNMLGDVGVWLEYQTLWIMWKASRLQRVKEIFLEFKMFLSILFQMKDVFWIDCLVRDGPMSHGRFPKNVNIDSGSPSSRVLRVEDVRGVESDSCGSLKKARFVDDSVLYNAWGVLRLHGKEFGR